MRIANNDTHLRLAGFEADGSATIAGTVTASGFVGNGSGLTGVAPATGSPNYVAKAGATMTGTLNLPANGLNAGNNQLVLNNGNVGIGTAAPDAKLDVAGALQVASMAQQSLGANGYVQIGELIIQWGQEIATHDINNQTTTTLTFPKPFPNEVFVVVPAINSAVTDPRAVTLYVTTTTKSQVTLNWDEWIGHIQRVRASYIAIGR